MKTTFEKIEIEIYLFEDQDVITTSEAITQDENELDIATFSYMNRTKRMLP